MIATLIEGEADWADVLFLVAFIVAIVAAVCAWGRTSLPTNLGVALGWVALAALAFGLLLL